MSNDRLNLLFANASKKMADVMLANINKPLFFGYEFPDQMTVSVPATDGRRDTLYIGVDPSEPEIPVTAAMMEAGIKAARDTELDCVGWGEVVILELAVPVYRAMAALAPTKDVRQLGSCHCPAGGGVDCKLTTEECRSRSGAFAPSPGADHQTRRIRDLERDGAKFVEAAQARIAELEDTVRFVVDQRDLLQQEALLLRDALARRSVAFTASNVTPEPEPFAHNPFRDFGGDQRRIGG